MKLAMLPPDWVALLNGWIQGTEDVTMLMTLRRPLSHAIGLGIALAAVVVGSAGCAPQDPVETCMDDAMDQAEEMANLTGMSVGDREEFRGTCIDEVGSDS